MNALAAADVTVRFGGLTAVDGASIEVPQGGLVGLIGPNGAGKTTFFNVICGFQDPTGGRVLLGERDITTLPASTRAKLGVGRTFQKLELFGRMTVFDNLLLAAEAGASKADILSDVLSLPRRFSEERRCAVIAEEFLGMLDLRDVRDRQAADLPIGTARIVELARALAAGPKVLLLDEPSSGLDSDETRAFSAMLLRLNADLGLSILIVEHDMDLVTEICKQLYVLDFGRLIASGSAKEILNDPAVRTAYLGEEDDAAAAAPAER